MRTSFHRVVYEALDVCNAVSMATVEEAVARTGLASGARALDVGCGNAAVSIRLAERFGLDVTAVELDPAMADLAAARIAASPARDRIDLRQARSGDVLADESPFDLIVALGVTEPVGEGVRDPAGMLAGLASRLQPGGWILWGDLVWTAEPPEPLRQLVEMTNTYADDAGWRAAAEAAGLTVEGARLSDEADWATYRGTMDRAVADWLAAHPDHPDAPAIETRARQVAMMWDFGRDCLGFGLYRLRRD